MIDEITPGLFRIRVPLPDSPLQSLNSYVMPGNPRNLIVDTGFNRPECLEAMQQGIRHLSINLDRTDFFITHLHADHYGLVGRLATPTSRIYFSRPEAEIVESWEGFEPMIRYAAINGFPESELRDALNRHPGNRYGSDWMPPLSRLSDGDMVCAGDFQWQCVETPGHTLGHTCLWESRQKLLISGDHILGDITPNIQCWSDVENPLKDYLASLEKTSRLDVELVLPGHRRRIPDIQSRIRELRNHHKNRLEEILNILRKQPMSAYEVASRMHWDIRCDRWEDFPVPQKWFATGEAISHLRYLKEANRIVRHSCNGRILYEC